MKPLALLLCAAGAGWAQEGDPAWKYMQESKRQVSAYLAHAARVVTDRAEQEIRTPDAWEKLRPRRLREMRDMLGLDPWPSRTPLNVQITGRLDKGDYIIENIAFESMPKVYVTGNLYLPKNRKRPAPGIIYVCGHAPSPYGAKVKYQRRSSTMPGITNQGNSSWYCWNFLISASVFSRRSMRS